MTLINREIEEKGLRDIRIIHSGCAGLCSREPMVTIESLGLPPVKYCDLNEEKVQEIFNRHVLKGEIVEAYALAYRCGSRNPCLPDPSEKIPHFRIFPFSGTRPSGPCETKA